MGVDETVKDEGVGMTETTTSDAGNGPFGGFRAGLDFGDSASFKWGPYLGASAGTYITYVSNCDLCDPMQTSTSIDETALHYWFRAGVQMRAVFIE